MFKQQNKVNAAVPGFGASHQRLFEKICRLTKDLEGYKQLVACHDAICALLTFFTVWAEMFTGDMEQQPAKEIVSFKQAPRKVQFWPCFAIICGFPPELTLSQPGFFWSPTTKPPPPTHSKNHSILLRIYSSKDFLKACPRINLLTPLWCPWKPWLPF